MNKELKIRNKKGISLIVLIITIAVIIILATAVILSIANNRPIESAKEAKDMHNNSVLLESAGVLSAQWKTDILLGKTTKSRTDYIKEGLSNQGFTEEEIGIIEIDDETGKVTKKDSSSSEGSSPEGSQDEESTTGITATKIASNPQKYYGKEVTNYAESSNSNVGWKIFYSDESNIYLIASDYIPYANIPNSTKNGSSTSNKPNQGSSSYPAAAYFTAVLSDYTGSASITESKIQNLNSEYFKYLNGSKTSTNDNMKAVAYMLDTKAWEKFKGDKAEYAIGGPTSEIFIKSWNAKYPDLKIEYQVKDVGSSYTALNGYTYTKFGTTDWKAFINYAFRKSDQTYDDLYVITSQTKAYGMWLASPSGAYANHLSYVSYIGYLHSTNSYYNILGFRPVVCLKSSVKLEEKGSGKYAIE